MNIWIYPHILCKHRMVILIYLTNDPLLDIKVVYPSLLQKKKKKRNASLNALLAKILCTKLCSQNKFPEVIFLVQGLHIFNTVDLYVVFFSLVDFHPFDSRYKHWQQSKVTGSQVWWLKWEIKLGNTIFGWQPLDYSAMWLVSHATLSSSELAATIGIPICCRQLAHYQTRHITSQRQTRARWRCFLRIHYFAVIAHSHT